MSKAVLSFVTLFFVFFMFSCSNTSEPTAKQPRALNSGEKLVADAGMDFGLDIFKELGKSDPDENIFISPLSIAMALTMAYNGANGTTAEEMSAVLGFDGMSLQEINESYQSLMEYLTNLDPKVKLTIANSVWCDKKYKFETPYQQILSKYFKATIKSMDVLDPNTPNLINQWASDNTNGKIDKVIDNIDPLVVMYLLNAIYFKGDWTYQFDKKNTQDMTFTKENNEMIDVKMMKEELKAGIFYNDIFSAVDLPYGNKDFSMTLFLPNHGKSTSDIMQNLTRENWISWTSQFQEKEVSVGLPKFKLSYKKQLKDQLMSLGMVAAFGNADFHKICISPDIYISKVQHNSYVDVNEEGTEAAAVTTVEFEWKSTGNTVIFNRPFVLAIRERKSNTILFLGKIMEPKSN